MLILFAVTLFLSAALLFLIQPMVARMVLPYYGGSPAVWNTCVLFFQAGLLAGYAYAHIGPARLGLRRHAIVHLLLMLLPFFFLPIYVTEVWAPPETIPPVLYLLTMLVLSIGLPFFLVSATTPLVQHWFAGTAHASAKDPYFLYAASNLGSLLALLSYPIIIESTFNRMQQSYLWLGGYIALLLFMVGCAVTLFRSQHAASMTPAPAAPAEPPAQPPAKKKAAANPHPSLPDLVKKGKKPISTAINWTTRLRWVVLAFIPSSLMLSVTTYLTTDIAAVPMLWVIPLSLYLLTFILTFAPKPPLPHTVFQRVLPLTVLLIAVVLLSGATEARGTGILLLMFMHLFGLFVIGMACHGELAKSRPATTHLTEFYLLLATGGALGGVFNALIAPVVFMQTGITEYPLVLVMACIFAAPQLAPRAKTVRHGHGVWPRAKPILLKDILPAVGVLALALALVLVTRNMPQLSGPIRLGIVFGIPAVLVYTLLDRPLRYGLGIGALFIAGIFYVGEYGHLVSIERSFFGVHRITLSPDGSFRKLIHGNIVHGMQNTLPWKRKEPLTYYHRSSPIGSIFSTWRREQPSPDAAAALVGAGAAPGGSVGALAVAEHSREFLRPLQDIAVVGLGTGTMAAYAQAGQEWTFYEIDPSVVRIAREDFTYLRDAEEKLGKTGSLRFILGDARLQLAQEDEPKYDLLVIDAFTSDAVPLHLLTREAFQIYRSRLKEDGILACHISNRYLNLEPVLAELAADAGLLAWQIKEERGDEISVTGKSGSHWVMMGSEQSPVKRLAGGWYWARLEGGDRRFLWTDDFSNLFSVFQWFAE